MESEGGVPPRTRFEQFLDKVRADLVVRRHSAPTVEAYVGWVRRFVLFHGRRNPSGMGAPEVAAYLSHLANVDKVSASTQNQALAALLFLYTKFLKKALAFGAWQK